MMKLLIVDDEQHARESISQMLALYYPDAKVLGAFSSVPAAIEAIKTQKPDVLLLDVEIGKESGFDILKQFPNPSFKIIFITAYQQYAIDAFRFAALDYLLKPIDPDLLTNALSKAHEVIGFEKLALKIDSFLYNISHHGNDAKRIVLKTASDIHVVNISDIMYCEADLSYTTFYLVDKSTIVVSSTLGEYEELLDNCGFFRIHKSYLLNLNYLKRYEKEDGGQVILKDQTCLPVSKRKKEQFLQQLELL